jgi:cyanate lyase
MDSKEKYRIAAKTELLHRRMSVADLARQIRRSRYATSAVVQGNQTRFTETKRLVDEALGLSDLEVRR